MTETVSESSLAFYSVSAVYGRKLVPVQSLEPGPLAIVMRKTHYSIL